MKKFYTLLLCTLMSIVGFSASAINLTVKVDNPALVTAIKQGNPTDMNAGKGISLEYSAEGTLNTFTPTPNSYYLRVYLASPKTTKVTAKSYKADGTLVSTFINNKKPNGTSNYIDGTIMNWNNLDGGSIVIEVVDEGESYVNVEIVGDPSKVEMSMAGTVVKDLVAGTNKVKLTNKVVSFKSLAGREFFEFKYNDVVKNPSVSSGDGSSAITYNYTFSSVQNNDKFYINTEFPDVKFNVTIDCGNHPEFVTSVTLDDVPVTDFSNFQVDYGKELMVRTDYKNYKVNSVTINGNPPAGFSGNYSTVVKEDISIVFDVVPLERNNELNIKLSSALKNLSVINDFKAKLLESAATGGEYKIMYSNLELPIELWTESASSSEDNKVRVAYINDVPVAKDFYQLRLTEDMIHSGDVVFIDYQTPKFKVITESADLVDMTLAGNATAITSGAEISVPSDPENNRVIFSVNNSDYEISSLLLNGAEQKGTSHEVDGVYTFTPAHLDVFEIVVSEKAPNVVYFNINNPGALYGGLLMIGEDDYYFVTENENVINLDEYEDASTLAFGPVPGSTYYASSVLLNGVEVKDVEEYSFLGIGFQFPIKAGDRIDVTMDEKVRDQRALFYISGIENLANPYIAEVSGNAKLHKENLVGDYNEIYFHSTDNPVLFQADKNHINSLYVYHNDELVDFQSVNYFELEIAHNDVVKVYAQAEAPKPIFLNFSISSDGDRPLVTVDHINEARWMEAAMIDVEDSAPNSYMAVVLPGTHVAILPPEKEEYKSLTINGQEIEKDENGYYCFTAQPGEFDDPDENYSMSMIQIDSNKNASSIDTIGNDNAGANVEYYNMQGVRIAKPAAGGIFIKRQGDKVSKVIVK